MRENIPRPAQERSAATGSRPRAHSGTVLAVSPEPDGPIPVPTVQGGPPAPKPASPRSPSTPLPSPHRLPLLAALVAAGCSTTRDLASVLDPYRAGRVEAAADLIASEEFEAQRSSGSDGVIWLLEEGKVLQDAGRFEASERAFARADRRMRAFERTAEISVTDERAGIVAGDGRRDYRGRGWEKILLEVYRSLNALALADLEEARVFSRRAFVRQAEAVAAGAEEIEAARGAARSRGIDPRELLGQERVREHAERAATLVTPAYADYANPLASFLAALFAWVDGDLSAARVDLAKTAAMVPGHPTLEAFSAEVGARAAAAGSAGRVVVLLECGLAPLIVEDSVTVASDNGWSRLAVPALAFCEREVAGLAVESRGSSVRTLPLADVDAVVAADFKRRLPGILLRALTAAFLKEAATTRLRHDHGDWGAVLGSVWKLATSGVDRRTWSSVGAQFQLAHLDRPADGLVTLAALDPHGGRHLVHDVELPDDGVVLLLVRSANLLSLQSHVLPLTQRHPTPQP